MKIIVCIKQVPNTTEIKIDPVTNTLKRDGVPSIINPDDKAAIEAALQLKDQCGAQVTVISMGPPQADKALREALAMGADEAFLITDRAFGARPSTVILLRSAPRSQSIWAFPRSPMLPAFLMTKPPEPSPSSASLRIVTRL